MYLYIDIIQTILELIQKFYNLNEPESRSINSKGAARSMIYTGDEAYDQLYCQKEEDDEEEENIIIKRTNSAEELKIGNENDGEKSEKSENINKKRYNKIYSSKVLLYKDNSE